MPGSRSHQWLQGALLAAPLAAICAWLAGGAIHRTQDPSPAAGGHSPPPHGASLLPGFPPAAEEFPAERLEERVDGAAEYLRAQGCTRLAAWKLADPPADLELLIFDAREGAAAVLARDAGPGRDTGPGEEASVSDQAILFRRGAVYARLIADPGSPAPPGRLMDIASSVDVALARAGAERWTR